MTRTTPPPTPAHGHEGDTQGRDELACELPGGGHALFTTRAAGNLSLAAGEGHEQGLQRREELCERLGLRWLCASRQTHGSRVHVVNELQGTGGAPVALDADAHATARSGVGVMVLAADCLPIAIGGMGAVVVVHAGWRGLAGGVIEQAVGALRALTGASELTAIVGPAAGACCYEVGPEVHAALGVDSHARTVDLRAHAHERLRAVGVANVQSLDVCTICDERCFSHRRERERAGRQAVIAWLS